MALGKFAPKLAQKTDLRGALAIGLDEALTALEESFCTLSDEQAWAFPIEDRHNIVTLVMHCLENLDTHACLFQTGRMTLEHEARFDIWKFSPRQLRPRMTSLPTVPALRQRLQQLREAIHAGLSAATEADLHGPRCAAEWCQRHGRTSADAYMRTIFHTMAHVRQVWLLRGLQGLTDKSGWPEQHWA